MACFLIFLKEYATIWLVNTSSDFLYGAQPMKRTLLSEKIAIPSYYLSVVARNLTERKIQWRKESIHGMPKPEIKRRKTLPPGDPKSSIIVHVNSEGIITTAASCGLAHGVLSMDDTLLSAQHGEILRYTSDLRKVEVFSSFPYFNDLHTLRITKKRGILVASSGTDAIFELSADGKEVVWSWWGREHEFTRDAYGVEQKTEKEIDHRNFFYNTWQRTIHVNSALPFDGKTVLATFFHQGIMCRIDRESGRVTPIVHNLRRPHALRWSGDHITFADTARGTAYRGILTGGKFKKESSVHIDTNWLQDCQYTGKIWVLVDAEHARVYFTDPQENVLAYDQFDPNWDFFEVTPTSTG